MWRTIYDRAMNKREFSHNRRGIKGLKEAQEFQRDYYNRGFQIGDRCPFGEGPLQELHWEKRIRLAKKYIQSHQRILDIGCGDGTVTRALAQRAVQIVGIDISEECIKRAKRINAHPSIDYFNGPLEEFRPREKFDVVLMFEFIEHIYDPITAFELVRLLLKDEGILILSTPNFSSLVRRIKKWINPLVLKLGYKGWDEIAEEHICEYTFSEVLSMLESQNFKIIKKDGVILAFPFVEVSKKITRSKFIHCLNFYSGSLIPSLAIEMYIVAKRENNWAS